VSCAPLTIANILSVIFASASTRWPTMGGGNCTIAACRGCPQRLGCHLRTGRQKCQVRPAPRPALVTIAPISSLPDIHGNATPDMAFRHRRCAPSPVSTIAGITCAPHRDLQARRLAVRRRRTAKCRTCRAILGWEFLDPLSHGVATLSLQNIHVHEWERNAHLGLAVEACRIPRVLHVV
jgi:hypothetical protein